METCRKSEKPIYYSLAFDEIAIRQQIIFDGNKMLGRIDYGGLSSEPESTLAKSALFCLATEINGSKSFPIAYILTDGLKAEVFKDVVSKCIRAVVTSNGRVLSIAFDGLKSNFTAMEKLGASLDIASPDFQPFIQDDDLKTKTFIVPDASHMFKLVRNTFERCQTIINGDGEAIEWKYIQHLHDLQEKEQLRAGNRITSRHVHFHQKKMNVKLCVQVLSNRTASSIEFCRKLGLPEFENSGPTVEFLRVNNFVFDLLNTRPFGKGTNEPLSRLNKLSWLSLIKSAKNYYMELKISVRDKLIPIYQSKYGTFVRGIITALTSIDQIMESIDKGEVHLSHLPTYRLSQDPLEVFFGGLRRRLGCNDNPNVAQLSYSVRAMLCFKLSTCGNGNCDPQENLLDKLSVNSTLSLSAVDDGRGKHDELYDSIDLEALMNLSLFVENVVVYIAGFVGKRLAETITCTECINALSSLDDGDMQMREDFILLFEKDSGGLFKPSENLVHVCKIAERIIRVEQSEGVFHLNMKRIERIVRRECLERHLFSHLHCNYSSKIMRSAAFNIHTTHKLTLISEICKMYNKTRLHYIAKRSSLQSKPVSNRCKLTKLVHFTGC